MKTRIEKIPQKKPVKLSTVTLTSLFVFADAPDNTTEVYQMCSYNKRTGKATIHRLSTASSSPYPGSREVIPVLRDDLLPNEWEIKKWIPCVVYLWSLRPDDYYRVYEADDDDVWKRGWEGLCGMVHTHNHSQKGEPTKHDMNLFVVRLKLDRVQGVKDGVEVFVEQRKQP